jgi:methylenetetrahydrofolate dehydrogenase (NADP+)/methenyltetrahydrofolate cyclohydrolase
MEILDHYGIDCKGKKAVVIGRSLVVGKPAAMMLMAKNATVTICHTRTVDPAAICREADLIISAAGFLKSLTKAFVREGQDLGYAPCTPAACMEILDHYGIDCKGKKAVVIGRSLVVGKPAAMMLMAKNATVTMCHTRTVDPAAICREADIIISAAGVLGSLTKDFVREGQIVIDVSMNWNPEKITSKGKGGMSGDAVYEEVEPIVEAITPVPGGVGAVTTSVLMKHVVEAAEKA